MEACLVMWAGDAPRIVSGKRLFKVELLFYHIHCQVPTPLIIMLLFINLANQFISATARLFLVSQAGPLAG